MESPKGVCSRASRKEYAAHLRSEAAKQVKRTGEQVKSTDLESLISEMIRVPEFQFILRKSYRAYDQKVRSRSSW